MASELERHKVELPQEDAHSYLSRRSRMARFYTAPWWFVGLVMLWVYVLVQINSDNEYRLIFEYLDDGIPLTLSIAFISYAIALVVGLLTGIVRAYPPKAPDRGVRLRIKLKHVAQTLLYNVVTFYIEFMRGIPAIVFLLIAGFIVVPAFVSGFNDSFLPLLQQVTGNDSISELSWRGRDPATAIAGLSIIYGAFLSEIFRAGIQSIPKGQIEAAKSLGLTYTQIMRFIIVPQAVRIILPPLGNDFIAMIKDTSLVTILGTPEITQLARRWSGSSFQYLETYLVLSLIYLTMTVSGSILVQLMERHLKGGRDE